MRRGKTPCRPAVALGCKELSEDLFGDTGCLENCDSQETSMKKCPTRRQKVPALRPYYGKEVYHIIAGFFLQFE